MNLSCLTRKASSLISDKCPIRRPESNRSKKITQRIEFAFLFTLNLFLTVISLNLFRVQSKNNSFYNWILG